MFNILVSSSDHELLIKLLEEVSGLSAKVDMMNQLLTNHLEHHFVYTISMITALVTIGIFACKVYLDNRKLKKKK